MLPNLPLPLPDETLYSWCHAVQRSSSLSCTLTSSNLFGKPRAGFRHDFPAYLDTLTERTAGGLGTAAEIIDRRSLLGFSLRTAEKSEVDAIVHAVRSDVRPHLRISAPSLYGRYCVAPLLRELLVSHPDLELDVQFSDHVEDLIASGFDLAIRIGRLADTTSLVARLVAQQRMAIFASPGYLRQHGTPLNAEDLASHWAVTYGRGASIPPWVIADAGHLVPVQVRSRERYDDLQVVADAAVAGAGLAWMPRWLGMPHVESGELKLVMDSDRVPSIDIHLLWPRTRFLPTRTRAVIEGLAAGLKRFEA